MDNINEIYTKYKPYALTIARAYISDEEQIKDILQFVFYKLSKQTGEFKNASSIMAWIKVAVIRRCLTYQRSNKIKEDRKRQYISYVSHSQGASTDSDQAEKDRQEIEKYLLDFIVQEIDKLTPQTRTAFTLYYYEQLPCKDIANIMGISENTVYNHLMKARDQLRMQILFNKNAAPFLAQRSIKK